MGATAHTYETHACESVRHGGRRRPQGCRVPPHRVTEVRSAGVRLTRRGRAVLIITVAFGLLGGLWLTAGRGAFAGSGDGRGGAARAQAAPRESVIVGRHDTLWEIATRARPEVDPRITVHRIIDLNSLSGPIVQPGQRLLLPAR
ncbi:MAG TPA: LysM peptidoglycan-binding domain-containing protein [Streptosporangiaceae bacterium]